MLLHNELYCNLDNGLMSSQFSSAANQPLKLTLPVSRGDKFHLYYTTSNPDVSIFIYTNGEL